MGDEWETPDDFFNGVDEYFNVLELDVCASESNHKLYNYYTKKEDGLKQEWVGKCWCNPPYSKQKPWIEKAISSVNDNNAEIFMLIPMNPETKYFQELILNNGLYVKSIYLIKGRLSFLQDKKKMGSPKFGSCLIHFKHNNLGKIDFYTCDKEFKKIKCVG